MVDKKKDNRPRRPKLHSAIWEEVRDCPHHPDFVDRRMSFWANIRAKQQYQFEFLICKICGHTIVLEEFIEFNNAKIDCGRDDLLGFLHDVTMNTKNAATQFKNEDTKKDAISMKNIRFISKTEGGQIIRRANNKKIDEIEKAREAREKARQERANNHQAPVNNVQRTLDVNRAKQKINREEKQKKSDFKCRRTCGRSFATKAKLLNHKCNRDDVMTYVEAAKANRR